MGVSTRPSTSSPFTVLVVLSVTFSLVSSLPLGSPSSTALSGSPSAGSSTTGFSWATSSPAPSPPSPGPSPSPASSSSSSTSFPVSLRATPEEEELGMDDVQLGEFAYDYVELTRHLSDTVSVSSAPLAATGAPSSGSSHGKAEV